MNAERFLLLLLLRPYGPQGQCLSNSKKEQVTQTENQGVGGSNPPLGTNGTHRCGMRGVIRCSE